MKNRYLVRSSKKRQNRYSVIMITIVLIVIIVVVSVGKYNLKQKKLEYDKREQLLTEQIKEQEERATEIEEYEKYTKTKKYAEEVAKEQLGLVNDDEIVFKTK
ncbi:MAG: septum formation initiator family protein [Lachnospiraceae bacterium]|nr:septum formation initiator family protein [Candidatus Colinaster equi]